MASASACEAGDLFFYQQKGCPVGTTLEEMGYPQPTTPLTTDNQTAKGIAANAVKQKFSKFMAMCFYWI